MIPGLHESFELYATIVTPIRSNSEQGLEHVVAPATGRIPSLEERGVPGPERSDYRTKAASPLKVRITVICQPLPKLV